MVVALLAVVAVWPVAALDNGLGLTPQMGFNTWNRFGCNINETLVRETIDALVSSGLVNAGYKYINLDDCWQSWRDSMGVIHADNKTFPNGIPPLADYAHSKGLLFGLYSDAGTHTCQERPGSLGYEKIDAKTYAEWKVDYLKYDNCNANTSPRLRYPPMRDALNATGRRIFFSMCEWGIEDPATWAREVGNSWRTTGDINASWKRIMECLDENDKWWKHAGPGGWNDPDMLEVGNGGLSIVEQKSHFSLWALVKSPLLIGCDVRDLAPEVKAILSAPEVIAINQDPLGVQGHKIVSKPFKDGTTEIWSGPLSNGDIAVILFNRASSNAAITVTWQDLNIPDNTRCLVRDVWARRDVDTVTKSFSTLVEPHGVFFGRFHPQKQ